MRRSSVIVTAGLWIVAFVPHVYADESVVLDKTLGHYTSVPGISGNLNSVGSDTLNNLMTLWAERFRAVYPGVRVQVEGKGSGTAPPALAEGTAQLGPMSREMKASEVDAFEKRHGYPPTSFRVAVDALGVFVSRDNPLKGISLPALDAAFSAARKRGFARDVVTWGDLGLTGEWAAKPISLYGRNSASGTYAFFKEQVLENGDYKNTVKEQPGSASVVQGISVDRFGLGYSGIGYQTSSVRALPLAPAEGEGLIEPSQANAYSGAYPIARFLLIYVNKQPGKPLDPMVEQFVKLVLAREGQEIVIKDGLYPVTAEVANAELEKLK